MKEYLRMYFVNGSNFNNMSLLFFMLMSIFFAFFNNDAIKKDKIDFESSFNGVSSFFI